MLRECIRCGFKGRENNFLKRKEGYRNICIKCERKRRNKIFKKWWAVNGSRVNNEQRLKRALITRCRKCRKDISFGSGNEIGSHRYPDGTWLCNTCDIRNEWNPKKGIRTR